MEHIQKFKEFLDESQQRYEFHRDQYIEKAPVVYIQQNYLWWSWSPDSGVTTHIKGDPDKFRGYFTNDPKESTWDINVDNILKWSRTQKSIAPRVLLYKIPAYWGYKGAYELSVWGGSVQPDYYLYMLLSTYRDKFILSLFKTKKEALAFAGK